VSLPALFPIVRDKEASMDKNAQSSTEPAKKNSGVFFWVFIGINSVMALIVIIKFLFSK
jgi:hypothetical protein